MSDALLVFDREGRVQLINPAFSQLMEKNEDELRGVRPEPFYQASLAPGKFNQPLKRFESQLLFYFSPANGRELFLEASLSPIQKTTSEVLAWVTLIRDITELKRLRKELLNLKCGIERSSKIPVQPRF
jgi:PAS domain S-box-containing protein